MTDTPTRRAVLQSLGAFMVASTLPKTAHAQEESSLRELGENVFVGAINKLYSEVSAESLRSEIGLTFWNVDTIAQALASQWNVLKNSQGGQELIEAYLSENLGPFLNFTTDEGTRDQSLTKQVGIMVDDYFVGAVRDIANNGSLKRDYERIADRGLQAFILNYQNDHNLSGSVQGVAELVKTKYLEAVEQFVRQTLIPSLQGQDYQNSPSNDAVSTPAQPGLRFQ